MIEDPKMISTEMPENVKRPIKGWRRLSVPVSIIGGLIFLLAMLLSPNSMGLIDLRFEYNGFIYEVWDSAVILGCFIFGYLATSIGILIIYFFKYSWIPWVREGFNEESQ